MLGDTKQITILIICSLNLFRNCDLFLYQQLTRGVPGTANVHLIKGNWMCIAIKYMGFSGKHNGAVIGTETFHTPVYHYPVLCWKRKRRKKKPIACNAVGSLWHIDISD